MSTFRRAESGWKGVESPSDSGRGWRTWGRDRPRRGLRAEFTSQNAFLFTVAMQDCARSPGRHLQRGKFQLCISRQENISNIGCPGKVGSPSSRVQSLRSRTWARSSLWSVLYCLLGYVVSASSLLCVSSTVSKFITSDFSLFVSVNSSYPDIETNLT